MTYVDTSQRDEYTATALQTVFAYTFRILADSEIKVYDDGVLQTLTTHYTVSGAGTAGGGNVTFVTGVTLNNTVILVRNMGEDQSTDYTASGPFPATSHETALDKLAMKVQDLQEQLDRAFNFGITSTLKNIDIPEGSSATDRASKVFAYDTAGTDIELIAATNVDSTSLIAVKGDIIQGGATGAAEKLAVGATSAVYQVVAGKIASVTNPIFLLPTVADLTNMNHTHASTAQGGALPASSVVAPPNYRSGYNCSRASTTTITVTGGVIDVDGTTVTKTTNTTLTLTTATDWVDDTSDQANSTYGYVYINAAGKIEMDDVAPDESDTSGSTLVPLRYNDTGTDTADRRMIGWFYMNSTGSGELFSYEVGNLKDGDVQNAIVNTDGTNDTLDDTSYGTDLTNMTSHFYSSGRGTINIVGHVVFSTFGSTVLTTLELHDGSDIPASESPFQAVAATPEDRTCHHSEAYAQGGVTFDIKGKVASSNATVADKTLSITEM
jgi:hypothetical protein